MDIQAEKLGLIQWLSQVTDEKVIAKIKALRNEKSETVYQLSEKQEEAILLAENEIKNGYGITHEDVMKDTNAWLEKK